MKKSICILAMLFGTIALNAQVYVKSTGQTMVENAVKTSLVIVRSSFQIKDNKTGMIYGLNGKKEFGEQFSYGIKVTNGILLNDLAIYPWNYNEKYSKYKNDYSPVLSAMHYSDIGDTLKHDSLGVNLNELIPLSDSSYYYCKSNTFDGEGLSIDSNLGEKAGWLLWITIPKETNLSKLSDFTIVVHQQNVEITKKEDSFGVPPINTENNIIGGLFVVPNYEKIGSIDFRLVGILNMKNGKWELSCPFYNFEKTAEVEAEENGSETEVEETPNTEELTPVDDKPVPGKRKRIKSKTKN